MAVDPVTALYAQCQRWGWLPRAGGPLAQEAWLMQQFSWLEQGLQTEETLRRVQEAAERRTAGGKMPPPRSRRAGR